MFLDTGSIAVQAARPVFFTWVLLVTLTSLFLVWWIFLFQTTFHAMVGFVSRKELFTSNIFIMLVAVYNNKNEYDDDNMTVVAVAVAVSVSVANFFFDCNDGFFQ